MCTRTHEGIYMSCILFYAGNQETTILPYKYVNLYNTMTIQCTYF